MSLRHPPRTFTSVYLRSVCVVQMAACLRNSCSLLCVCLRKSNRKRRLCDYELLGAVCLFLALKDTIQLKSCPIIPINFIRCYIPNQFIIIRPSAPFPSLWDPVLWIGSGVQAAARGLNTALLWLARITTLHAGHKRLRSRSCFDKGKGLFWECLRRSQSKLLIEKQKDQFVQHSL